MAQSPAIVPSPLALRGREHHAVRGRRRLGEQASQGGPDGARK